MGCVQDKQRNKGCSDLIYYDEEVVQPSEDQLRLEEESDVAVKQLKDEEEASWRLLKQEILRPPPLQAVKLPPPSLEALDPSAPQLERIASEILPDSSSTSKKHRNFIILVDQSAVMNALLISPVVDHYILTLIIATLSSVLLTAFATASHFVNATLFDLLFSSDMIVASNASSSFSVFLFTAVSPFMMRLDSGSGCVSQVGLLMLTGLELVRHLFWGTAPPSRMIAFITVVGSMVSFIVPLYFTMGKRFMMTESIVVVIVACFANFFANWTSILLVFALVQLQLTQNFRFFPVSIFPVVGGVALFCTAFNLLSPLCSTATSDATVASVLLSVVLAFFSFGTSLAARTLFSTSSRVVSSIVKQVESLCPNGVTIHFCREGHSNLATFENVSSVDMASELFEGKNCYGASVIHKHFANTLNEYSRKKDVVGTSFILISDFREASVLNEVVQLSARASRRSKGPEELTITAVQVGRDRYLQHCFERNSAFSYNILNFVLAKDVLGAQSHEQFMNIASSFHPTTGFPEPSAPPMSPLGGPIPEPQSYRLPQYDLFDDVPRLPAAFRSRPPLKRISPDYRDRKYILFVDNSRSMYTPARNQLLHKISMLLVAFMWFAVAAIMTAVLAYFVGSQSIIGNHSRVAKFWSGVTAVLVAFYWLLVDMPKTKSAVAKTVARRVLDHIFDFKNGGSGSCDVHYGCSLYDMSLNSAKSFIGQHSQANGSLLSVLENFKQKYDFRRGTPTSFIIITDFSDSYEWVAVCQELSHRARSSNSLSFTFVHCPGNSSLRSAHTRELLRRNPRNKCKYNISDVISASDVTNDMTFSQFIQMQMPSER